MSTHAGISSLRSERFAAPKSVKRYFLAIFPVFGYKRVGNFVTGKVRALPAAKRQASAKWLRMAITDAFKNISGAAKAAVASTMLAFAAVSPGNAAEGSPTDASLKNAPAATCPPPMMQPETGKTYSRKEAYRASTDGIVLHYGEGVQSVDIQAKILTEGGRSTIALSGGPKGHVEVFVGRTIIRHHYTQDELDMGELGHQAAVAYDGKIARGKIPKPCAGDIVAAANLN